MNGYLISLAAAAFVMMAQSATAAPEPRVIQVPTLSVINIDIDVPPDRLWDALKVMYLRGRKFEAEGYTVEQLDGDPFAYLGGIRIRRVQKDGVVEERVATITRIDDKARLLAISVLYSEDFIVRVTYEVRPSGQGSNFHLIAHVDQKLQFTPDETPTREAVAARIGKEVAAAEQSMMEFWKSEKIRIEARK